MKRLNRLAACAVGYLAVTNPCDAVHAADGSEGSSPLGNAVWAIERADSISKAASAQVLGTRATVTPSSTLYGGFQITSTTNVYILVRGNSLGTLGVTQAYLDAPRVRIYNSQGADLIFDVSGNPGFNNCSSTGTFSGPVYSLYAARGQPPHSRDACTAHSFVGGVYTFTVTPAASSFPSFGEVLFEVSLNP